MANAHVPDPELLDEENPEATDEWFSAAKPAAEVLPSLFGGANASEPLPTWQVEILEQRLRDDEEHPEDAEPWADVRERLLRSFT